MTPGERVTVKPDLLLKSVLITTRYYKTSSSSTANTQSGDLCLREESKISSDSESWIMLLKADNGGQLPAAGGSSQYAYLDFFNENVNRVSDFRPTVMIAAYKNTNGIFNGALLSGSGTNPNLIGNIGNSCTVNGDCGNTGRDPVLNESGNKVKRCFAVSAKGSGGTLYGASTKNGLSSPIDIYGETCSVTLRRLSWREIF